MRHVFWRRSATHPAQNILPLLGAHPAPSLSRRCFQTCTRRHRQVEQRKAQIHVGEGSGRAQDFILAHMWYNLAYANGNSDTRKLRQKIEDRMTPTQVEQAQRLARDWAPNSRTQDD